MKHTNIPDLITLDKYLSQSDEPQDFFIELGRNGRSSKSIFKDGVSYNILNKIDNSEQLLTPEQMLDSSMTNIGHAMLKGCFFKYDSE